MAAVLTIIADLFGYVAALMGVFAFSRREPRLMTGALGQAAMSMLYGAGAELDQRYYTSAALCGAGLVTVALLMWRAWPDGWNPWRQLLDFVTQGRLAGYKDL